jgi:hypothetical protein
VVKHSEVVKHPVENVVKLPDEEVVKPYVEVAKQFADVVVKKARERVLSGKDRHKKTEARAEYMRNYMREYMKSRRSKISQKNLGENA